jgi:phosphoadenosine phosphosulfate reductase
MTDTGLNSARRIGADEVEAANAALENASAEAAVAWAAGRFGEGLMLACSFQDAVLLDLVLGVAPETDVVFCDTGGHFAETLAYVETLAARYDFAPVVARAVEAGGLVACGGEGCCEVRKVAPMRAAVEGYEAWMAGVKRVDALTRAETPVVGLSRVGGGSLKVKVNPLAGWSEEDVSRYAMERELPAHPLLAQGYLSSGRCGSAGGALGGE